MATEPGSVEPVRGELSVDNDGQAVYTIPLWVPEGRRLTPDLTLQYRGLDGFGRPDFEDSEQGFGWSFPTMYSEIASCTVAGEDSYQHRLPNTVEGTGKYFSDHGSPEYCLDGKPLVLVGGTHMRNGADYRSKPNNFARIRITEVLNLPAPFPAVNTPTKFTVETKDGLIHEYAIPSGLPLLNMKGAEVVRPGSTVTAESSVAYRWLRTRTRDRYGNEMRYSYRVGNLIPAGSIPGPVRMLLSSIEYAYTGGQPRRRIEFSYSYVEQRPAFVPYVGAAVTKKLDTITIRAGDLSQPGTNVVRTYSLSYALSPLTYRLMLEKIKQCDGSGLASGCSGDTVFDYKGLHAPATGPGLDRMATATDSLGAKTSITYAPLTDSTVFVRTPHGSDPLNNIGCADEESDHVSPGFQHQQTCLDPNGSEVVASYSVEGPNGPRTFKYVYRDGRVQGQGFDQRWLGFNSISREDVAARTHRHRVLPAPGGSHSSADSERGAATLRRQILPLGPNPIPADIGG